MKFLENVLMDKPFLFSYRNITKDGSGFTAFHAHSGLEFLYVEQGSGHILVDNQIMPIQPQSMYIFQPYQLHRVHAIANEDQPYVRSILVIDPYMLDPYLSPFSELRSYFQRLWKEELSVQAFEVGEIAAHYELLQTELRVGTNIKNLENVLLTLMSVIRLIRSVSKDQQETYKQPVPRKTGLAEHAMTWLETHYREEFSLPQLASSLHVSPFYLSRLFKQSTGTTIQEYITAKRLREACILLQNTDYSMTYIAEQVGLATFSYFIHTFKKHVGITPLQYRKQMIDKG